MHRPRQGEPFGNASTARLALFSASGTRRTRYPSQIRDASLHAFQREQRRGCASPAAKMRFSSNTRSSQEWY